MPPKPRKALRTHALMRAREAPCFSFCKGVGRWAELTSTVQPQVCLCTLKWGGHRSKDDPHSPPGPAPDPLTERGTGDTAPFLGSRHHWAAVPRLLPPRALSNTGRAVQLQFPDFCLQPSGREHLHMITMCFGLYAKTSFYHRVLCHWDFPHTCPTAACQAGPSF